jgi:hypothetical protein
MKPEGSIPHSQELSICPYPEPEISDPSEMEKYLFKILSFQ